MGIKDDDLKLQLNSNGGIVKIDTISEPSLGKSRMPLKFSEKSKDFIDNLKIVIYKCKILGFKFLHS